MRHGTPATICPWCSWRERLGNTGLAESHKWKEIRAFVAQSRASWTDPRKPRGSNSSSVILQTGCFAAPSATSPHLHLGPGLLLNCSQEAEAARLLKPQSTQTLEWLRRSLYRGPVESWLQDQEVMLLPVEGRSSQTLERLVAKVTI